MSDQRDLFGQAGVAVAEPEPKTEVRLGSRVRRVKLQENRREALQKFQELLVQLEGKDIYIEHDGGSHAHFHLHSLKLGRMKVERPMFGDKEVPSVIVLRGNRGGCVRISTDRVVALRRQEYFGYTLWLLDFWNGFGEYPLDRYRKPGYDSLQITRFND